MVGSRIFSLTGRYLYRKYLALKLIRNIRFSHFLEVGFGNGDFSLTLAKEGYKGVGIDISFDAVGMTQENIRVQKLQDWLEVAQKDLDQLSGCDQFDLVVALEVLEHTDDDEAVLRKLYHLLEPEGHLLLSVPAHRSAWGAADVWAGHFRRYERDDLLRKLQAAGFQVVDFLSYGFPVMSLAVRIRNLLFDKHLETDMDITERTSRSGVDQLGIVAKLSRIAPLYFQVARLLGGPFIRTDLGDGYVALARRR